MQKIDDGARPESNKRLLPPIKDFTVHSDDAVMLELPHGDLFLSVDQDQDKVEAKIDQDGHLIVQVREKFRCEGFSGVANVEVRASTGIFRSENDFSKIIK